MKNYHGLLLLFLLGCITVTVISCNEDKQPVVNHTPNTNRISSPKYVHSLEESYSGYNKELIKISDSLTIEKVVDEDIYIFEGDILLTEEDLERFNYPGGRSAVTIDPYNHWPFGQVYYEFDESADEGFISRVEAALEEIHNNCGVDFYLATQTTQDKLVFVKSSTSVGNNSYIGRIGGAQTVNVTANSSYYRGIIMHEVMHALGFYHEHTRLDRDNYITINESNIKPNKLHNFNKRPANMGYDIMSLDDNSVMMYSSLITDPAFVYDTSVPAMFWNADTTRQFGGQREHLSDGDKHGLKSIYGPPFNRLYRETIPISSSVSFHDGNHYYTQIDSVRVYLVFYTQRNGGNQTVILYPRRVSLKKDYLTLSTGGEIVASTYTTTVDVHIGDTQKLIDAFRFERTSVGGQYIDYYNINYSILR